MVLILNISKNINLRNLHPITNGKLSTKNFEGIVSIVPAGFKDWKLFLTQSKMITCEFSPFLEPNGLTTVIATRYFVSELRVYGWI